jgi:hypothetical protein
MSMNANEQTDMTAAALKKMPFSHLMARWDRILAGVLRDGTSKWAERQMDLIEAEIDRREVDGE